MVDLGCGTGGTLAQVAPAVGGRLVAGLDPRRSPTRSPAWSLGAAAAGVRSVLAGELSLFRCRYLVPGEAGSHEVTVLPLADGDGAVVTHRPAPDPHGARSVR
ncbi:MAG TPA: hypothetical protein VHM23_06015 [Actinomycetota bacterium]|nr:hypothetical protein [Actinomycetota bacterium]